MSVQTGNIADRWIRRAEAWLDALEGHLRDGRESGFIKEWVRGDLTMTALRRKYGISRQTGYKWVNRWQEFGYSEYALVEFSRTPHSHPSATDPATVDLLVRARKAHPTWGPRKL